MTLATLHPVILSVTETDRSLERRERVRALSRHARRAVAHSCDISGLRLDRFPKDADGVPLPVNGVYWSLSHKPSVVGGIAATVPVGIDLETVRPMRAGVMARTAEPAEWRLAGGQSLETFFRFWTAKEAVLKAVGVGFAGMSRCRVVEITDDTHMRLTYDAQSWPVQHCWFGGHVAAVTARAFTVSWTVHA